MPPTPDDVRAYSANVRKFYLYRFLRNFQFWMPIWVLYLTDERGLSLTEVTALDAPFWITVVLMEVPTGAVADRFGRKVSLSAGTVGFALAVFIFGIGDTFPLLLAAYLAWGVSMTLESGADAALVYDSLRAAGRESEYARLYGRAFAFAQLGTIAGTLVGAPLAAATNLAVPVVLSAGVAAAAWLVTLTFREPPRRAEGEHQAGYVEGVRIAFGIVARTPALRYMMLLAASAWAAAACTELLRQPFLDLHGVEVGAFGWFALPGEFVSILMALGAYRIAIVIGANRLVLALPLVTGAVGVALGAWDSLGAFVFYPAIGVVFGLSNTVVSDYINARVPSAQRATVLSLFSLMFSLMIVPLEPALGAVADSAGLASSYRVITIAVLTVSLPLALLWLRSLRIERRREQLSSPAPA
jgi:MFS family permease